MIESAIPSVVPIVPSAYSLRVVVGWNEVAGRIGACIFVVLGASSCVDSLDPVTRRRLAARDDTCLITDFGEVRCLATGDVRLRDPLPAAAIDIDVASAHACAVLVTGAVACWGSDQDGKLGNSSNVSGRDPYFTNVGDPFIQVSVSDDNSCAVTKNGKLWCWGSNSGGQLGHADPQSIGDDETAASAAPVPLADKVVAVELVHHATCVVFEDGRARCWGNGLVIPEGEEGGLPVAMADLPLPEPIVALSGGRQHMCALSTTGNVYCWGTDGAQFSYATYESIESPSDVGPVELGEPALEITAGGEHTCARLEGGRAKCWGNNGVGQLGLGKPGRVGGDQIAQDSAIDVGGEVLTLAAGESQTCALLDDGMVRCWGDPRVLGADTPDDVECYDSMPFPDPLHGDPPTIETFDCTNDPACCFGDDEHPAVVRPFFVEPEMQ